MSAHNKDDPKAAILGAAMVGAVADDGNTLAVCINELPITGDVPPMIGAETLGPTRAGAVIMVVSGGAAFLRTNNDFSYLYASDTQKARNNNIRKARRARSPTGFSEQCSLTE